MDETIKIKCPFCGALLQTKLQPGLESKYISCPVCRNRSPFTAFTPLNVPPVPAAQLSDPRTDTGLGHTVIRGGETLVNGGEAGLNAVRSGMVKVLNTGQIFQLRAGKNVIGRKASNSSADFKIDTGKAPSHISREHIVISVENMPVKGTVHKLSLYKEKVNSTAVGKVPILFGDSIFLSSGDKIMLPDGYTLLFLIPDPEQTI